MDGNVSSHKGTDIQIVRQVTVKVSTVWGQETPTHCIHTRFGLTNSLRYV